VCRLHQGSEAAMATLVVAEAALLNDPRAPMALCGSRPSSSLVPSPEDLGARFAAFAVGCLGAPTSAKAGGKLGLMGSASEEEFVHVLVHLETLTRQRAAKLANVAPTGAGAEGVTSLGGRPTCTQTFTNALLHACGMPLADLTMLFAQLPHDGAGRADLLRVFGLRPTAAARASTTPHDQAADGVSTDRPGLAALAAGVVADYVEQATTLPEVSDEAFAEARAQLVETSAAESEGDWANAALALNVVRAVVCQEAKEKGQALNAELDGTIVVGMAARCGSRRPALAKCALRALAELAVLRPTTASSGGGGEGEAASSSSCCWGPQETSRAMEGCLVAVRGTKLVAKLAEDTLQAVTSAAAGVQGMAHALGALAACVRAEATGASPQPAVISAGLRVVASTARRLGGRSGDRAEVEARQAVEALCADVLASRRLAAAFGSARAALQALPPAADEEAGRTPDGGEQPSVPAAAP